MRITYLTQLTTSFNPFSPTSHVPRLFLQLLPNNAHKSIKIKTTQLPRTAREGSLLELGFKDGKSMKFQWKERESRTKSTDGKSLVKDKEVQLNDIVEEVERHARVLGRKEDLAG